jgi:hypothetical protein
LWREVLQDELGNRSREGVIAIAGNHVGSILEIDVLGMGHDTQELF